MLWDDENLYIWFMALDEDLRGTLKGKTAALWSEDVVEVFLVPDFAKGSYYELELAPSNEPLALQIAKAKGENDSAACQLDPPYHNFNGDQRHAQQPRRQGQVLPRHYQGALQGSALRWQQGPGHGRPVALHLRPLRPRQTLRQNKQELSAAVPLSAVSFHISDEYGTMKFGR